MWRSKHKAGAKAGPSPHEGLDVSKTTTIGVGFDQPLCSETCMAVVAYLAVRYNGTFDLQGAQRVTASGSNAAKSFIAIHRREQVGSARIVMTQ